MTPSPANPATRAPFVAHSLPGQPQEEWEPLELHLDRVAGLATRFAAAFDAAEWGRLAGLWHDLGKYRAEFQRRIRGSREQAPHAGIGAAFAADRGLLPLAFAIAGHHAGLANPATFAAGTTPLTDRLAQSRTALADVLPVIPAECRADGSTPSLPEWMKPAPNASRTAQEGARRSLEFWTRMIFSALVDADFLATERFCTPMRHALRRSAGELMGLFERLERRLASFTADTPVNQVRRTVLDDCLRAAKHAPGVFSLTVPTGGGKTLSSMAFALRHATLHGLRRVVVAIPFTSIIEQSAGAYREIFGPDAVVEHHSNLDEIRLRERYGEAEVARHLATENWDAPVVVTTNVQLFESIFSNRPSRCRRLHNLARSVLILDEAQALPPGFLIPALDALRELVEHYGCTVLLSTATQPALAKRTALPAGLNDVCEIVPDSAALARDLSRVDVRWPSDGQPTSFVELAERLAGERQVLAIVHRRQDARELALLIPPGDRYHLSALMCPAHRGDVLSRVRMAIAQRRSCRLVSTQVVEAGVDIDFPVVFRALAGLDSLVQAAGRCNREGTLRDVHGCLARGRFEIFVAPTAPPAGILRCGLETTEAMLARHPNGLLFGDPTINDEYFRLLYSAVSLDVKGIQAERTGLNFATTAERFRLIDSGAWPIVVPWADASTRLAKHVEFPTRDTFRSLQPFTVQVYDQQLQVLQGAGALEELGAGLFSLTPAFAQLYDPEFGLLGGPGALPDPEAFIA